MGVSFCIPFWGSDPRRLQLLNFVGEQLLREFPDAEIVEAGFDATENQSEARNMAAAGAKGDILVFMNPDVLAPNLRDGIEAVQSRAAAWCIPYTTYLNVGKKASNEVLEGRDLATVTEAECDHVITESWASIQIVPRTAFEAVQGWDTRFQGWGYEDNAFNLAMEMLWGHCYRPRGFLYHLWHDPGDQFSQPYIEENRRIYHQYLSASGHAKRMQALMETRRGVL